MVRTLAVLSTLVLPFAGIAACGDGGGGGSADDTGADAFAFDVVGGFVGCETAVAYADGLEVPTDGGSYAIRFLSAEPTPPDVDDNRWELAVVPLATAMSEPIVGATITVEPWMPGHGHGVFPPTYEGTTDDAGAASIGPFNIIMPGFWEFRTSLTLPDGTTDSVTLAFCIEG